MKKTTLTFLAINFSLLFATSTREISLQNLSHYVTYLIMQIGLIIIFAKFFGAGFEKLGLPSVLGEITCGIVIGPYLLGSLPIFGFPHGIFPQFANSTIHITPELYSFATIASIILLFITGLKTDLDLLLRYFYSGFMVGVGGIVVAFACGNFLAQVFFGLEFWDPMALFLGTMTTATSVGITARILSDKKKMRTPEGVSILSAAVIDDIIAIILLAIVVGIAENKEDISTFFIIKTAIKTIGIWAIFTGMGLIFAHKISKFLKMFRSPYVFSIIALSIAFMIAAIFEKTGLAMIIGAYVAGLSLSKTDIAYVLLDSLKPLELFFVPIFFTVMGMMVDINMFLHKSTLLFGLVYSIAAILAKVVGSGLFCLPAKFNKIGALRIGLGMAPRGEVIMIMAGFGLANGIINEQIFSSAIMLVLMSAILPPLLLNKLLENPKSGITGAIKKPMGHNIIEYKIQSRQIRKLITEYIVETFANEGFFISLAKSKKSVYQIRKNKSMIKLVENSQKITLNISKNDTLFAQTIVYEALVKIQALIKELGHITKPNDLGNQLINAHETPDKNLSLNKLLLETNIILEIQKEKKDEIIREMLSLLSKSVKLKDEKKIYQDILKREQAMSTAIGNSVALPHAKSIGTTSSNIVIGIKSDGVDFKSLDGKPTKIIILFISPDNSYNPHIRIIAELSKILGVKANIEKILNCKTQKEVFDVFTKSK